MKPDGTSLLRIYRTRGEEPELVFSVETSSLRIDAEGALTFRTSAGLLARCGTGAWHRFELVRRGDFDLD